MLLNCGVGEDSWDSLGLHEIQPVHPKGDWSWVFSGRTDVEAETPALWPPDAKSWFIWKDPDDGKDWGQEEKGITEDEMVGWHHWLDWHEFGWTLGVGDGQGGLAAVVHVITKRWTWQATEVNWTESFPFSEFIDLVFSPLFIQVSNFVSHLLPYSWNPFNQQVWHYTLLVPLPP